jgi:hypothetical protein
MTGWTYPEINNSKEEDEDDRSFGSARVESKQRVCGDCI